MKKGKLFINIATLVLSLCLMVYGVYAAKTATLKTSGNIGFIAHDLDIKIGTVTISNALDASGNQVATVLSGYSDSSLKSLGDIALGALYFDDLTNSTASSDNISNIVIKINLVNNSKFAASVSQVTTATALPDSSTGTVTGVKYTLTVDKSMTASGGKCTITITLTKSGTPPTTATGFKITTTISK